MKNTDVQNKLEEFYEAFCKSDWEKVSSCLAENFKYFTDNTFTLDKNGFIDFMKKHSLQETVYKISDLNIILSGSDDLACTAYKITFNGRIDSKELIINAIETTVFKRENNTWKVVHLHASNEA